MEADEQVCVVSADDFSRIRDDRRRVQCFRALGLAHQFDPFDLNPLRLALAEEIDFERLRAQSPVKLLIAATRVRDGELRMFRETELSIDMVLASACLPLIHHTVEVLTPRA